MSEAFNPIDPAIAATAPGPRRGLVSQLTRSAIGLASSLMGNAVIFLIIVQSVGPAAFGRFGQVFVTASLLALIVDYGYPQRMLRDIDMYRSSFGGIPARTLHLKAVLTLVMTIVLVGLAVALRFNLFLIPGIWLGLLLISYGFFFGACLRASEHHGIDSRHQFIANLAGVLFALALLVAGVRSVLPYTAAFVIVGGTYLLLNWRIFPKYLKIRPEPFRAGACRSELKNGLSFASDVLVLRAHGFLDVLILSLVASPIAVGLYQAGQKLMQAVLPWNQSLNNVMLPKLSRRERSSGLSITDLLKAIAFHLTFGVVTAGIFYLVFDWLVRVLLTPEFYEVMDIANWLALTVLMRATAVAPSLWITAAGFQTLRVTLNTANLLIFIFLCFTLSSRNGFYGTAQAIAIAATTGLILNGGAASLIAVRRYLVSRTKGNVPSAPL